MAVIRVEKTKNYTVMSNYHLRDNNLSLKAKGLMSLMLSLPENWDYSVSGLARICCEGKDCITSALNELEDSKYLVREQNRTAKGQFGGANYILYEKPFTGEQVAGQPMTENPITENQAQLNTNKTINNKQNKEELNTEQIKEKNITKKEIPPTIEEVYEYANGRGRGDLAKNFYDYYTATNWCSADGKKVKSWKGKFVTWEMKTPKGTQKQDFNAFDYLRSIMEEN